MLVVECIVAAKRQSDQTRAKPDLVEVAPVSSATCWGKDQRAFRRTWYLYFARGNARTYWDIPGQTDMRRHIFHRMCFSKTQFSRSSPQIIASLASGAVATTSAFEFDSSSYRALACVESWSNVWFNTGPCHPFRKLSPRRSPHPSSPCMQTTRDVPLQFDALEAALSSGIVL